MDDPIATAPDSDTAPLVPYRFIPLLPIPLFPHGSILTGKSLTPNHVSDI